MRSLKAILAVFLAHALAAQSVLALPARSYSSSPVFKLHIPSSLGYISETYSPPAAKASNKPDIILIQDLHVNRSVQFAISGILKRLKAQNLMPDHIAVEGDVGPIDIKPMQ